MSEFFSQPWLIPLIVGACILLLSPLAVAFTVLMERKVLADMQARLGPMRVGPQGLLQTIADAVKLLLKEDVVPAEANRVMFRLAPVVTFFTAATTLTVIPFSARLQVTDTNVGLLVITAMSSVGILGIILGGWSSNSHYSLLGGLRSGAQLISYEVPVVLAILAVVFFAQSMSTVDIVEAQSGFRWFIFQPPLLVAAFVYMIGQLAETNRTPFDLPEAESELVSGFHTEYSGIRFAMFFLAEFANTFFASALAVVLFFGGWDGLPGLTGALWLVLKSYVLVFVLMWIRWTVPRVRVDQLLGFAWKVLVPIGLIVVLWAAATVVYAGGSPR